MLQGTLPLRLQLSSTCLQSCGWRSLPSPILGCWHAVTPQSLGRPKRPRGKQPARLSLPIFLLSSSLVFVFLPITLLNFRRICVLQFPEFLMRLLWSYHDHATAGHTGQMKMYLAVQQHFYWLGLILTSGLHLVLCPLSGPQGHQSGASGIPSNSPYIISTLESC